MCSLRNSIIITCVCPMKFYWYTAMPITYMLSATAFELQVEIARETIGSQNQKYSPSALLHDKLSWCLLWIFFFFFQWGMCGQSCSVFSVWKSLCFALFSGILGWQLSSLSSDRYCLPVSGSPLWLVRSPAFLRHISLRVTCLFPLPVFQNNLITSGALLGRSRCGFQLFGLGFDRLPGVEISILPYCFSPIPSNVAPAHLLSPAKALTNMSQTFLL